VNSQLTSAKEINAAATITALVLSPLFDLQSTYFLIGGIAGVNPEVATICSVTFARYAVQVALQYEIDAREIPANFSNGYVPLGSMSPDQYPLSIYVSPPSPCSIDNTNRCHNWPFTDIAIGY